MKKHGLHVHALMQNTARSRRLQTSAVLAAQGPRTRCSTHTNSKPSKTAMASKPLRACIIRQSSFPYDIRPRKEAEALRDAGWEVTVLSATCPGKPLYEKWRGIYIYRLPFRHTNAGVARTLCEYALFAATSFFLITVLQVFKMFRVIQVNTMPDTLVFSTVLARLLGASVVVDMQELMPEMFRSIYRADAFHPIVRFLLWIERRIVRYCSYVFTVNASTERRLLQRGVPREKLSIVHNVPDGFYYEKPDGSTQEFDNGRLGLFYHGSILPRYGLDTLVRATALLQKDIPGVSLTIAGTGSAIGALRGLVTNLGLDSQIHFLGFVPFEQVPRLIARADICVAPLKSDLYTDLMLPNKLFEWAAAQKPIVAARLKAIEEFYGQDSLAYFTPGDEISLAQTILNLYQHPAHARQLAENAFRKYYPVRWEQQKRHYSNRMANVGRRFRRRRLSTRCKP